MDDARLRIRKSEGVHENELASLGELGGEGLHPVDDLYTTRMEVLKEAEGIENPVPMITVPGRRTHTIEDERVLLLRGFGGIVEVVGGEELDVGGAATIQLRE